MGEAGVALGGRGESGELGEAVVALGRRGESGELVEFLSEAYYVCVQTSFFQGFFFFFLRWTLTIKLVTILLLFYVLFFLGHKACGILSSLTGDRTHTPCMGGEV